MDSVFVALGQGIQFDKRRFRKEVDLFERPAEQPHEAASPPASAATGEAAHKRKKQKLKHMQAQEGVAGIELFSNQQQQQQDVAVDLAAAFTQEPAVATGDPFEEANVIRKAHRIKVSGSAPPGPLRSFAELAEEHEGHQGAPVRLLHNLAETGFKEPTPIQRQATTALLAGRELLAIAPTGSGKTLAFLLPLIVLVKRMQTEAAAAATGADEQQSAGNGASAAVNGAAASSCGIKAVVVSPTKELAMQTARVLKLLLPGLRLRCSLLTKATAAGTDFSKVDILLANPLRLGTLAQEGNLDLSQVRYLILDEADKLFDMGFTEQIDAVIAACRHPDIVRCLFSATLPEQVETLARSVLQDPLRITVGERNTAASTVSQRLLFVGKESGKLLALRQAIAGGLKPPVLVFVATKDRAKELHRELMYDGVHVDSIHANQSQAARQAAVDNFRSGSTWVLIATDLIGRGMDFLGVNTVINFDFPKTTTDYIHRVGRTGRAGRSGEAITLFTEDDAGSLRGVANIMRASGCEVPDWMLTLKKGPKRRAGGTAMPAEGISTEPHRQGKPGSKGKGKDKGSKRQAAADKKRHKQPKQQVAGSHGSQQHGSKKLKGHKALKAGEAEI